MVRLGNFALRPRIARTSMQSLKGKVKKRAQYHMVQVETLGARSAMGVAQTVAPRRAEPERVINNLHSRVARARRATARDDIPCHCTSPLRPRHFCLFTPINHRPRSQCEHYLPLTTTSSRYID